MLIWHSRGQRNCNFSVRIGISTISPSTSKQGKLAMLPLFPNTSGAVAHSAPIHPAAFHIPNSKHRGFFFLLQFAPVSIRKTALKIMFHQQKQNWKLMENQIFLKLIVQSFWFNLKNTTFERASAWASFLEMQFCICNQFKPQFNYSHKPCQLHIQMSDLWSTWVVR